MSALQVFVYGTLKKGEANHHYLSTARYRGECRSAACYTLLDLGAYPAVRKNGRQTIQGEVYAVDAPTLQRLDELEDYPDYYDRELIDTPWGQAWMYFIKVETVGRQVLSGNWKGDS